MSAEKVIGKWKLVQSDNFDEFLKELGVGLVLRKVAGSSKPVVEITKEGDEWQVKTETAIKTSTFRFKLGEKFQQERLDGVKVDCIISEEDGKLVEKQLGQDKEVIIIRELSSDTEMKTTCTVGNATSVRTYQKV